MLGSGGAWIGSGSGGGGVTSLNTLTGALTLAPGTNITLVPSGNTITINASGGGGTPGGSPTQLQYDNSGVFGGVPGSAVDAPQLFVGFQQATPLAPLHVTGATGQVEPAPASVTVTDAIDSIISAPSGFVLSEELGPILPTSVSTTIIYIDPMTGSVTGNDFPNTPSTLIAAGQTWSYTVLNYRIVGGDKVVDPTNSAFGMITDTLNDGSQVSVFLTGWGVGVNTDGFILIRQDGSSVSPTSWIDIGTATTYQDDGFLNQDAYFLSGFTAASATRNTNIAAYNTFNSLGYRSAYVTTPSTDDGSGLYMIVQTDYTLTGTDLPFCGFINGGFDVPSSSSVFWDWGQVGLASDLTPFSADAYPNFNTTLIGTNSTTFNFNYGSGTFIADGSLWAAQTWAYRLNLIDNIVYFVASPDTSSNQADDSSFNPFTASGGWNPGGDEDGAVVIILKNGTPVAGVNIPNPGVSYSGVDTTSVAPATTPSITSYTGYTRTINAYGFVTSPGLKYSSTFNTQSFTDSNTAPYFIKQVISGSGYTGVKVLDLGILSAAKHVTPSNSNGTHYETQAATDASTGVTPNTVGYLGNGDTYHYKVWSVGSFNGQQVYSSTFVSGSITLPNDGQFYLITITPAVVGGSSYKAERIINSGSPVYDTFNGPSLQDDTTLVWGSTSTVTPTTAFTTSAIFERDLTSTSDTLAIAQFRNTHFAGGGGLLLGFNQFMYQVSSGVYAPMAKYGVSTDGNFFIDSFNHGLKIGAFGSYNFYFAGSVGAGDSLFNANSSAGFNLKYKGSSAASLLYVNSTNDTVYIGTSLFSSGDPGAALAVKSNITNDISLSIETNGVTANSVPAFKLVNTSGSTLAGINQLGQGYFGTSSENNAILHLGAAKASQTQLRFDDNSSFGSIAGGLFRYDINNSFGPLTYIDSGGSFRPLLMEPSGGFGANQWLRTDGSGHLTSDTILTVIGGNILAVSSTTILEAKGGLQVDNGKFLTLGQSSAGSSNLGDIWYNTTSKAAGVNAANAKQTLLGVIFTQTATGTVANTTTETSLDSTGVGTKTLPANFFVAGKTLRVTGWGVHSAVVVLPTIRIKVKFGSTVILDTTAVNDLADTNGVFKIEGYITCRTTGATGTVFAEGVYQEFGLTPGTFQMANTATVTIDTTTTQAITVTCTWGTASASNTISLTNFTLEVIN